MDEASVAASFLSSTLATKCRQISHAHMQIIIFIER